MNAQREKVRNRLRRKVRIRKRVRGTVDRPRLSVYRSVKQLYCQLIDDVSGQTLVSENTLSAAYRAACPDGKQSGGNCSAAQRLGSLLARKAKEKGVSRVVFDRSGYRYHGRIKALAESLRKEGINF
ncbi:MAG: 50S ribosomal protein L18 [Planctomycetes bacterium]|nr:50S ribosomal protein L18 [Planctomycetota bacterium]